MMNSSLKASDSSDQRKEQELTPEERRQLTFIEHYTREGQDPAVVHELLPKIQTILVKREIIGGFFHQKKPIALHNMVIIVTNYRLILYKKHLMGRAEMHEYSWQWLGGVQIRHEMLYSVVTLRQSERSGNPLTLEIKWLPCKQAEKFFRLALEITNFWGMENRVRDLQMERMKAGGYIGGMHIPDINPISPPEWHEHAPVWNEEKSSSNPLPQTLPTHQNDSFALVEKLSDGSSLKKKDGDALHSLLGLTLYSTPSLGAVEQEEESQRAQNFLMEEKANNISDEALARLQEVKDLLDQGLISEEEYDRKKKEIVSEI